MLTLSNIIFDVVSDSLLHTVIYKNGHKYVAELKTVILKPESLHTSIILRFGGVIFLDLDFKLTV